MNASRILVVMKNVLTSQEVIVVKGNVYEVSHDMRMVLVKVGISLSRSAGEELDPES